MAVRGIKQQERSLPKVMSVTRPAIVLALLSLAACERWVKPGATEADFEAAEARCRAQAYMMAPPAMRQVQASPGGMTPRQTRCTGSGDNRTCTTTGGDYRPPTYRSEDQNSGARRDFVRACLFDDGWRPAD